MIYMCKKLLTSLNIINYSNTTTTDDDRNCGDSVLV
jgi:hypothetical protein